MSVFHFIPTNDIKCMFSNWLLGYYLTVWCIISFAIRQILRDNINVESILREAMIIPISFCSLV